MSEWWQNPYPGGPMVRVAGFPRPLYPSDAAGYPASVPGPDVQAYKRVVSRAGRWQFGTFNQTYTSEFAHGKSGNVNDTGIAGIQRQQHLDATGYLGKTTFNTLRSIIIPPGLPHEGEYAMDDYAASLINQAWDAYGGTEPPPPPASTVRQMALATAITQIGTVESPPGSNMQPYGVWYGMNGVPWCALFASWCFEYSGNGSPSFKAGSYYSYVPYVVADARNALNGLKTTDSPIPGDLVCYDWAGDTIYDHVGIFEKWVDSNIFSAIEGNTSDADNSNGGQVMRRQRSKTGQATVFVRVAEP
jgi:hypothetical protein